MIEVAAAVEVDQWLESDGGCDVLLRLCRLLLLECGVVAVDVGLVVVLVVELHDLAGDGGFERAIVIWKAFMSIRYPFYARVMVEALHGRSGRVALPRTKLVLATPAALLEAPTRKAERTVALVRKSVVDMSEDLASIKLDTA